MLCHVFIATLAAGMDPRLLHQSFQPNGPCSLIDFGSMMSNQVSISYRCTSYGFSFQDLVGTIKLQDSCQIPFTLKAARWQDICADTGNQSFLQSRQRLKEMLNNGTIVLPDRWSPEPSQTLESIWVGRDKVMFKLRRTQRFRWSLGSKKILIQIHDSWLRLWLWLWLWLWLMTHD